MFCVLFIVATCFNLSGTFSGSELLKQNTHEFVYLRLDVTTYIWYHSVQSPRILIKMF